VQTPQQAWMVQGETYAMRGIETIGIYDRYQQNRAVFITEPGITVNVDDPVDLWTPATFSPLLVAIVRVYADFFTSQQIDPSDPDYDATEQWGRNKIAQYIKNNGTPGTMGGIPYYELDGVRMLRPVDVQDFLATNNLPGHEWLGGNSY